MGDIVDLLEPASDAKAAVLVIHSWWGLTESFRDYGRRLAQAGYAVGLADLFSGKTADTEAAARALRAQSRRVPIYKSLGQDLHDLRRHVAQADCRLGVVGFSMGGHWAVWLSQRAEYRISSTVLYYAARGGDFSTCRSSFLAHFAEEDAWVRTSARRSMEREITRAGCAYRAHDYPDTGHWFAESSRPADFNPAASRRALDRDIAHFGQAL